MKPQRHKETNVFKFKSFADRIQLIDLRHNALYHIQHINEEQPEENETHFRVAYVKWIALNLTDEYNGFQRKIRDIVTLPQLVHKKDFVVRLLLEALAKATTLSLQPLLEYVVVLAKDLREEFYPYFQSFLDRLIMLLRTQDADQLEWTLICLAYLFKTLKPFLKKDISVVFNAIMPLLDRRNPEHVTNFAAECFSFVSRDIKDKEKFLALVLASLQRHKNGVNGCGRLLFEIMRGVAGNLHSCAEEFLGIVFRALRKTDQFDQQLLFEVLTEFVLNLCHTTNPPNMQTFWDVAHRVLGELLNEPAANVSDSTVQKVLQLMGQAVEFRRGKMMCGADATISSLMRVADAEVSEDTLHIAAQMTAALLLCPNLNISQLDASRLTKKVLAIPSRSIFESFVWNVVKYSQFELLVLPEFLRYFEKNSEDAEVLELLCKIVLEKSPPSRDGITLANWTAFGLRFKQEATFKSLEQRVLQGDLEHPESLLMSLVVHPHVVGAPVKNIAASIVTLVKSVCGALKVSDDSDQVPRNKSLLFILSSLVECTLHIDQSEWLNRDEILECLLPFCQQHSSVLALNILDQLIATAPDEFVTFANFQRIHAIIGQNLSSEYHRMRLLTAHILLRFGKIDELRQSTFDQSIYDIFYYVESITAGVQTYRDQLMSLQKLATDMNLFEAIQSTVCAVDPLRYLLGALYINFNLLWKPVTAIIVTYSQALELSDFWTIFRSRLDAVTTAIRAPQPIVVPSDGFATLNVCLLDQFCSAWECTDRPDHLSYRIHLWRALPEFGTLSEIKNRDVVTALFDFIELEYKKSYENDALCWNLAKRGADGEDAIEIDPEMEDELNDTQKGNAKKEGGSTLHKGTQRTLIAIISVFAKLANPSQIHRQPDVYALLLELLCHRNPAIQKLALDCIMAYRHKYLVPYKDHLYGIIEEAKFKESITAFKIDGDENVVQPEHRGDLMPILLRILYSKMVAKVQKGGGQARKALVMRFLGSCQEVEVLQLLKMAFAVYESNLRDDPIELVNGIFDTLRLEAVLSPKKLQSSLNLVEIIREQFGGLMGAGFLKYLLNILYSVGAIVEAVLRRSDDIHTGHMKLFKNLRALCLQHLANFFNHFDSYPWNEREVDTVWTLFVSPTLAKLPLDGIHSATPLLKLFTVFSKNPRYFVLLTKQPIGSDGIADETPLRYCIDLLLEPKTKPLVCLAIMEIIQSLLQLSDVEPDESGVLAVRAIDLTHVKQPIRPPTLEHINFGSAILLPHLPKILDKFQLNLQKRRGLTKRDLHIVSRCTELVMDSKTSSALLELLLPILVRKSHGNAGEDALAQMVSTIKNLFEKIEEPEQHIRSIAPMFEQITAVGPRKLLCELVETIAKRAVPERRPALKRMSDIVKAMNAWDRRWVEQPDYEKRLMAYKTIGDLQAAGQLDMNLGLMTVYHSFYFIKHDKDLAMRDSASFHLKSVVPALARQFAGEPRELEYLVGNVILNLIRRTISDKNDAVRTEGIQLLGEMARECPEAHVVLQDLQLLTNKTDREVDFFDNITHMQNHRHIRALGRFCSVAKTLDKVPNSRTLTQFILPLATQYVCVEKHSLNHGLVTAAIESIGVVCHFLPWHQYESILKYYLKKMRYKVEYQKQLVRLVMQVLDAFHFDLSNAKMAKQEMAKKFVKEVEAQVDEADPLPVEKVPVVVVAVEEGEEEVVLGDSGDVHVDDELDVELNKKQTDGEEMEVVEEEEDDAPVPAKKVRVCVFDKTAVLTHKAAKRLVHTIATGLIPQLNNSITVISTYESFHKLNKKKRRSEREEEEILRVPIALAMVKLLQKLPDGMLDHTLPGILTKVCMFLKSPLRSVRMVTRDILKSIMQTVGNKYLDTVLQQLTSLLTRGFQVHVLTVTVHCILDAMKLTLKAGDIDRNMQSILAVILEDIFGKTSEEKEVRKIGMSTPEAKPSNKSFQSLHIIAINITESCLLDLLIPFKDKLMRTQSKTVVLKIQDCFQKIVAGLVLNKNIPLESLLMFIYGTASESIPDLLPGAAKPVLTESQKEKMRRARPDCFLIAEEPRGRTGAIRKVIKTNVRANAHVLVEFGLDMLHIILKRGKLLKIDYQPFIDPIVPVLLDSLKSTHIRVTTYALKCFASLWTREMRLPNLDELVPSVVPQVFLILHKYATAGMSAANENFNLVKNAFKTMVCLMRCVDYFTISEDQLRTLLLYIEQNLYDATKQTIAFNLLKVIIGRKLLVAEMHDVMRKISEIAVTSESSVSRSDAKSIMVNYLMDYPLGKKVDGFVKFFVANLNYEVAAGRESAIQVLHAIVKRFPQEVLNKKAGYLFLSLGARLVNDESADCRKLVAECVESLIAKLDANNRNQLFDIILMLLADTKISHREMAALLCTRFIVAERGRFAERIERVLPPLIATLSVTSYKGPGQFVRPPTSNDAALDDASDNDGDDDDEAAAERRLEQVQRAKDHQLIQVLNTLLKIFETHSTVMEQQHHQYVDELAYESQKLLAYEHVWVRMNAAKALDIILSRLDVERVQLALVAGRPSAREHDDDDSVVRMDFIYSNPRQQLKSLCLDLCAQLLPEVTDAEMAAQVTKNLLYIANLLQVVTLEKQEDVPNDDEQEESVGEAKAINLLWLIRRMRYVVHAEVAKAPHSTVLRTAVFHWIEGLAQLVDASIVTKLAPTLLTPVVREMSEEDKNIDAKLRQLALKVGNAIRTKIGDDAYNLLRSQLQTKLMIKRAERKKLIAQVKVNDPARAAMRKHGEQQRKKVAHKRKMDVLKGRALPKKKKVKRNADDDDMF